MADENFALERARYYAGWVDYGIRNVLGDVRTLQYWAAKIDHQRDFETEFEAKLDQAEKAATDALTAIKNARARYKSLNIKKAG